MMRRTRRWWLKQIAMSFALGVLISVFFISRWERGYADSAVTVLGSGDGLSTLVDIDATRILIVSGNDPAEFANALADARPGQTPRVDLVIVTPGATRIAARAIEIADPGQVLVIESPTFEEEPIGWQNPTTRVSAVSTIVIKDRAKLEIDPGFSIDSAMPGWSIRVRTDAGEVLISERSPLVSLGGIGAFVIAGPDAGVMIPSEVTRIASSTIPLSSPEGVIRISPGATMRIEI